MNMASGPGTTVESASGDSILRHVERTIKAVSGSTVGFLQADSKIVPVFAEDISSRKWNSSSMVISLFYRASVVPITISEV
jgi:hypothetical protein